MTLKSTHAGTRFMLVALVALVALARASVGCGGATECDLAATHVVDCVNSVSSPVSSTPAVTAKCEGETACIAACVNQTECSALQDAYGAGTSAGAKAFLKCTNTCAAP